VKIVTRAPTEFKVMNRTYKVTFRKNIKDKKHGVLNGWTRSDRLQVALRVGGGIHDHQKVETYLHEALHAIINTGRFIHSGQTLNEEAFITALAPHLLDFMRSNPDVVGYLMRGDADD
jgi:hypothetical protein